MNQRLRRRFGRLLRHGRWIVAGALLSMLAALIISRARPKIYAATTYILVSESKIGTTSPDPWEYPLLPTYIPVIDSDALIAQAVQHFHLDGAPYRLTPHRFRQRGYLDVRIPKSTRLIEIDVEFPDARLAADLANYLAQSAVELNDQTNAQETVATQKFLKERLDQAATHLSETEARRLGVRKRARIEDRETELNILLDQKAQVSTQLEAVRLALPQNESVAKSLQQSLSSEPRTFQLQRSVSSDRLLEHAAEKLGTDNAGALSATEEVLNTAHEELRRKLADSAAGVAGGREAIQTAMERLSQINRQIGALLSEVTQLRSEIERVDQEFKLAGEAYESASRDYHNASVTVTAKSQDLRHVAPAVVPEQPVGPRVLLNVILAGLLGTVLLSGVALGIESFRETQSEGFLFVAEGESVSADARHS